MKEAEYFQQARDDADFRRSKISELKAHKKFTGWMLVTFCVIVVILTLLVGLTEGKWHDMGNMLGSIILMAWVYTNTGTRLAALEAMDGKVTAPAERSLEPSAT